jgi:hypothetical protein
MMPKSALTAPSPGFCYDEAMKEVVSPDVAKKPVTRRKPQTKKHIFTPATVEQISRGVGVTKKDIALIRKVLSEMGYLRDEKSGALIKPGRGAKPKTRKS